MLELPLLACWVDDVLDAVVETVFLYPLPFFDNGVCKNFLKISYDFGAFFVRRNCKMFQCPCVEKIKGHCIAHDSGNKI